VEKKNSVYMCADELRPEVRLSTDTGIPSSSISPRVTSSSIYPRVTSSSSDPGTRPSAGPEARLSSDLGLLAGVAVIVIVLVVAAVCIVALLILWR